MDDARTPVVQALAESLRQFGVDGGFREKVASPALERLLALSCVDLRTRAENVDSVAALKLVLADLLKCLDDCRQKALTIFLQTEISGFGPDLTDRRRRAGREMVREREEKKKTAQDEPAPGKPTGISGRTWERRYEFRACEMLARALYELELAAKRTALPPVQPYLKKTWPLTLAVLPFQYSARGFDDVVIQGFADDIVARLSRIPMLALVSPTSSKTWAEEPDPLQAAREQGGVDLVLTGAIRQYEKALHVTVRLEDTGSRLTRWSETFGFEVSHLLDAQKAVADSVLEAIQPAPEGEERVRISGGSTTNAEAYELYLRGLGLVGRNAEAETELALGCFEQALALDDSFASAHAFKGYALWRQYFSGWRGGSAVLGEALSCADRALQIDQESVAARLTRIRVSWDLGQHEQALRDARRALAGNPHAVDAQVAMARALNNAGLADVALKLTTAILASEPHNVAARKLLIWNLLMTGGNEDAVAEGRAYLILNPADANTAWAVTGALLASGEYDEAIRACTQGLRSDMTDVTLWLLKGYVLRTAGVPEAAKEAWEEGAGAVQARVRIAPGNDRIHAWLAAIYACLGEEEAATREIKHVEERQPGNPYLAFRSACALAELGRVDDALTRLRRAIDGGFLSVQLLRFEERLGFTLLQDTLLYQRRVERLEQKVDALRHEYDPLVEDLVATTARNGAADERKE